MQNRPKVLLVYPGDKSSVGAYSLGLLYVAKSLQKINIDVSILHLAWDSIKKYNMRIIYLSESAC